MCDTSCSTAWKIPIGVTEDSSESYILVYCTKNTHRRDERFLWKLHLTVLHEKYPSVWRKIPPIWTCESRLVSKGQKWNATHPKRKCRSRPAHVSLDFSLGARNTTPPWRKRRSRPGHVSLDFSLGAKSATCPRRNLHPRLFAPLGLYNIK